MFTLTFQVVCVLFWSIFMVDKGLLVKPSEMKMKTLPSWYNHSCHSVGSLAIILDALLWKPTSVPVRRAVLMLVAYFGSYLMYVEFLIRMHNLYPYPILANFSETGRFGFYGVVMIGIALCFGVNLLVVRFMNKTHKKGAAKSQPRGEKKETVSVHSKQRKPKKAD
uniref:Uncharacterized protein n=1 Tax=Trichobilharzia regenti TaxID=157069 RepID=A0AA85IW54_TRIRE|nr:unnamed protein product [Trichobilharzia regenti]